MQFDLNLNFDYTDTTEKRNQAKHCFVYNLNNDLIASASGERLHKMDWRQWVIMRPRLTLLESLLGKFMKTKESRIMNNQWH